MMTTVKVQMLLTVVFTSLLFTQTISTSVSLPADFLNLLLLQRGQQPSDPCYDEFDKARYCRPDFVNAALNRPVEASSECGKSSRGPETFCRLSNNVKNVVSDKIGGQASINRSCYLCDDRHPRTSHDASLVTDVNDPRNKTCWVSSLQPYDTDDHQNNVTLTISLGKRFEITYISVTFCQEEPAAFRIWKSNDHGLSWQPFRMYARNCQKSYGIAQGETYGLNGTTLGPLPTTTSEPFISGRHQRRQARRQIDDMAAALNIAKPEDNDQDIVPSTPGLQPTCIEQYGSTSGALLPGMHRMALSESRVVFPTLELAPPSVTLDELDTSTELQKWISATDLKIEFSRLPAHYSSASVAETRYFSVSDLAIGGRCACNGHASRCVEAHDGSKHLQCDCRHNTQGEDCGQCKPFFVDRPWRRATVDEPNECTACNCNLHARQCRFNEELWKLSGYKSGGVCVGCRHNTAGRNCQYCREGFFRDHTKPITHRRACKVCECHPVGSLGRTCNQTTGQCPCKEGVEGISCSRCAPGYQQTNSPIQPCVKVAPIKPVTSVQEYQADGPYADAVENDYPPVPRSYTHGMKHHQQRASDSYQEQSESSCGEICNRRGRSHGHAGPRLSFSKWCQSHFAALIQLESGGRLRVGSWTRMTARLYRVFPRNDPLNKDDETEDEDDDNVEDDDNGVDYLDEEPVTLPSGDEISIWVRSRALECKCIRLREGRKWLVTGRLGRVMSPAPVSGGRIGRSPPVAQFILDPETSAIVRWRPELEKRLRKFGRMAKKGACVSRGYIQPSTTEAPVEEEVEEEDDLDGEPVVDAMDGNYLENSAGLQVSPSVSRRSSPETHFSVARRYFRQSQRFHTPYHGRRRVRHDEAVHDNQYYP